MRSDSELRPILGSRLFGPASIAIVTVSCRDGAELQEKVNRRTKKTANRQDAKNAKKFSTKVAQRKESARGSNSLPGQHIERIDSSSLSMSVMLPRVFLSRADGHCLAGLASWRLSSFCS